VWLIAVVLNFTLIYLPSINIDLLSIVIDYFHRFCELSFSLVLLLAVDSNIVELTRWAFCKVPIKEKSSSATPSDSVSVATTGASRETAQE